MSRLSKQGSHTAMKPTVGGSPIEAERAHETGHGTRQMQVKNGLPMSARYGMTVVHEPIGVSKATGWVQNEASSTLANGTTSSSPLLNQNCVQAFSNNQKHDRHQPRQASHDRGSSLRSVAGVQFRMLWPGGTMKQPGRKPSPTRCRCLQGRHS